VCIQVSDDRRYPFIILHCANLPPKFRPAHPILAIPSTGLAFTRVKSLLELAILEYERSIFLFFSLRPAPQIRILTRLHL
jgi:hypothetical protein